MRSVVTGSPGLSRLCASICARRWSTHRVCSFPTSHCDRYSSCIRLRVTPPQQVLISIQSLIFVAEPYFNEPGFEGQLGTAQVSNKAVVVAVVDVCREADMSVRETKTGPASVACFSAQAQQHYIQCSFACACVHACLGWGIR